MTSQDEARSLAVAPTVAVVDDDESIRRALYRLLRSDGLAAATFASALEFLEAHRRQDFACVVVDVYMGRMSGLDLAERLASEQCTLPIIVITAHDDEQIRDRARRVGVAAYLRKPVDASLLLDAVHRAARFPTGHPASGQPPGA